MEQHELDTKENDKGFTLIELLIVIVILGILATVVVFAVGGIRESADENVCASRKAEVATAAEAYRASEANTADDTLTLGALAGVELLNSDSITVYDTVYGATTTVAAFGAIDCTP